MKPVAGSVSIEPVVSVIRYHQNGGGFGQPYTFSCLMMKMADEVTIYGACGTYTQDVAGRSCCPDARRFVLHGAKE